jgi:hypothetical protein
LLAEVMPDFLEGIAQAVNGAGHLASSESGAKAIDLILRRAALEGVGMNALGKWLSGRVVTAGWVPGWKVTGV